MNVDYRQAFLALVVLQILYFGPVLFKGEVISPHDNTIEVAAQVEIADDGRISNRRFSDHSSQFIPTINQHLNGQYRAWLATWIPNVEFGRPDYQRWQSKANLITHALSLFTNSPFVLYTSLTVLMVCLTGIFCFLFLKSLGLHPLACFAMAAGLSLGPYLSYWLTFVQFISVNCWTLGLLWLVVEFIKKRSVGTGAGIAFFVYNLLIMGRLQTVVRSAYLIGGFATIYLWLSDLDTKAKLRVGFFLVVAALFGAVTTVPTYLDMMTNAARSARIGGVSDEFFLTNLPRIRNVNELGYFLHQIFDPFWFGNPIEPGYPFAFGSPTLTPLFFVLFLLSFAGGQWRRLWPWQLFVVACLLATLWPPAYLFMVHYMGFHISRSKPIGAAFIPAFVLAGYALDHILRKGLDHASLRTVLFLAVLILVPALVIGFTGFDQRQAVHPEFIVLSILLVLGTGLLVKTRSTVLLLVLVVVSVFGYGASMMLARPPEQIQTSSPLVEKIKAETADGSRYAWIGSPEGVLPANQEALLGIKSIHSYDSISSINYQQLVLQLSEQGTTAYGRHFRYITSDAKLDQPAFSYTGIGLILSYQELENPLLQKIDEINGIGLYKTLTPPVLEAQLTDFQASERIELAGFLHEQASLEVHRLVSLDDYALYKVTPSERETLLFVSQQYHPQWQATGQGQPLSTVMINDFYLGCIIPPHVAQVELEFKPFVRSSWIPQIIYIILGLSLSFSWIKEKF